MWLGLQGSRYGTKVAPAREEEQTSEEISEDGTKESGLSIKALTVMGLMQSDQANRGENIMAASNRRFNFIRNYGTAGRQQF